VARYGNTVRALLSKIQADAWMEVRTAQGATGQDRGMDRTWTALGGVVGPVTFCAAWVIGGAVQDGYSPVDEPISRLAAVDASARIVMNAGLVALGVGLLLFAVALRDHVEGAAWAGAAVSGLATLGVVAVPLGRSAEGDGLHGSLAFAGYLSLVAIPILTARRSTRRPRAALSLAMGVLAALCLLGALASSSAVGALQRAGLLFAHAWIVGVSVSLLRKCVRRVEGG